jgi:hypothetical protein
MEEMGIIIRGVSDWGARTTFPPKYKGAESLRVVYNFKPVNHWTVKP